MEVHITGAASNVAMEGVWLAHPTTLHMMAAYTANTTIFNLSRKRATWANLRESMRRIWSEWWKLLQNSNLNGILLLGFKAINELHIPALPIHVTFSCQHFIPVYKVKSKIMIYWCLLVVYYLLALIYVKELRCSKEDSLNDIVTWWIKFHFHATLQGPRGTILMILKKIKYLIEQILK